MISGLSVRMVAVAFMAVFVRVGLWSRASTQGLSCMGRRNGKGCKDDLR